MEKLNQWMTLLTNIGVLAGLVLLVYEVNQNTNALRNETDVAIYSMAAEDTRTVIENPDIAEVFPRAASKDWNGRGVYTKILSIK